MSAWEAQREQRATAQKVADWCWWFRATRRCTFSMARMFFGLTTNECLDRMDR